MMGTQAERRRVAETPRLGQGVSELVGEEGLEPSRLAARDPKLCKYPALRSTTLFGPHTYALCKPMQAHSAQCPFADGLHVCGHDAVDYGRHHYTLGSKSVDSRGLARSAPRIGGTVGSRAPQ